MSEHTELQKITLKLVTSFVQHLLDRYIISVTHEVNNDATFYPYEALALLEAVGLDSDRELYRIMEEASAKQLGVVSEPIQYTCPSCEKPVLKASNCEEECSAIFFREINCPKCGALHNFPTYHCYDCAITENE